MKWYPVALFGLVLGCLVGWVVPQLIYPWPEIDLTGVEPEEVGHLFQIFGVLVAGPIGFFLGLRLALWMSPPAVPSVAAPRLYDPEQVEDRRD